MYRGNYWEMTYESTWGGPVDSLELDRLDGSHSYSAKRIVGGSSAISIRWRASDSDRIFHKCDFEVEVADSFVSNCTFRQCRFKGSTWRNVKFSNCRFEQCHFSEMSIVDCHFVNSCQFLRNSASPETFKISDTAISATAFVGSITTNLEYLPPETSRAYQQFRLVTTREKIAKLIFSATMRESDVTYFHEAYEQLTRCSLDRQVAQHKYDEHDKPRRMLWFLARSLLARAERRVVCGSGWLTKWGQSVLRPLGFFAGSTAIFGVAYALAGASSGSSGPIPSALIQSINISLVAGYTAYFNSHDPMHIRLLMLVHLCVGLYWYSLIIPVISRRVMR